MYVIVVEKQCTTFHKVSTPCLWKCCLTCILLLQWVSKRSIPIWLRKTICSKHFPCVYIWSSPNSHYKFCCTTLPWFVSIPILKCCSFSLNSCAFSTQNVLYHFMIILIFEKKKKKVLTSYYVHTSSIFFYHFIQMLNIHHPMGWAILFSSSKMLMILDSNWWLESEVSPSQNNEVVLIVNLYLLPPYTFYLI